MRLKLSLTARMSLLFSSVLILMWWLSGYLMIMVLHTHFRQQDQQLIKGKLQLASSILSSEISTAPLDVAKLRATLQDAIIGHSDVYLSIKQDRNDIIIQLASKNFPPVPDWRFTAQETLGQLVEVNYHNALLRSISTQLTFLNQEGKTQRFIITSALNSSSNVDFIARLSFWLFWSNIFIIIISLALGWLTTRTGLKPLRDMSRLVDDISINNLHKRLQTENSPQEISGAMQRFNEMLERLEASFNKLKEFSSDIAHELRTPISNLMVQTQFALSRSREAENYREILYSNLEELDRLSRMIEEMLFLARSEHHLLQLDNRFIMLEQELKELAELFGPLADESRQSIRVTGSGEITGDPEMLRRAFSNLFSNALKYSPKGTILDIVISKEGSKTKVKFSNSLAEPLAVNAERLFERFYRADTSRSHDVEGSGLGLSITRSVIQMHGGTISASSNRDSIVFTLIFQ